MEARNKERELVEAELKSVAEGTTEVPHGMGVGSEITEKGEDACGSVQLGYGGRSRVDGIQGGSDYGR